MDDSKELKLVKLFKRNIQRGFGKRVCKELHLDCANCKAQILIGSLNWYVDLLEWSSDKDKKITRSSKIKYK